MRIEDAKGLGRALALENQKNVNKKLITSTKKPKVLIYPLIYVIAILRPPIYSTYKGVHVPIARLHES